MFRRKKSKADESEKTYFNVGILSINELDDDQLNTWEDDLMDAAENVGTMTSMLQADWEEEQLKILLHRFPEVDVNETIFMINEIIYEDIEREVKLLEQKYKWKKFFQRIPLGDYIDAEDRAVMDANKTLYCTNDVQEAVGFLKEQAGKADI